ncbi:hypothetical protein AX17_000663 [Amanita inopinata Kibby_2008]|nr:hypothetical protein AX17_000663 [Amanita inopinata Kibby_2008]
MDVLLSRNLDLIHPSSGPPDPSSPDSIEKDRASRETTIFSIYSMYGDDNLPNRTSWALNHPTMANRFAQDTLHVPTVGLTLPDAHQDSLSNPNDLDKSDLAYCDSKRSTPVIGVTDTTDMSTSRSSLSHGSRTTPRPASSYAGSSSLQTASEQFFDDPRASAGHQSHLSAASSSSGNRDDIPSVVGSSKLQQPGHTSFQNSLRSSRSLNDVQWINLSRRSQSALSTRDLPPLPPSRTTSPGTISSSHPSLSRLTHDGHSLTRPHTSARQSNATTTSNPNGRFIALNSPAPSSKVSIVPSEGEDLDAFHVRNTYAQLEVSGVKGDGYEEGVERTRARIGASRASQLTADAALADGSEKKGDLDPREVQTLASVDRYGFFSIPSHDRLVQLDSAPLLKRLSRTKSSGVLPTRLTFLKSLPPAPKLIREKTRIAKWTRMLKPLVRDTGGNTQVWSVRSSKESKLRERTYKGIPDCWRSAAWDMLMCRYASAGPKETAALVNDYREGLEKPSSYDVQIDLDVPRTISGSMMFKTRYGAGQRSLFHVLHSFSLRCSKCGYVQGMGPIAATLLCYFEPERVFAALVRLHDAYSLHTIFSPGFPGLLESIYVQERITEMMMPDVYVAFGKHMVSTTSYATKWYITLFANTVPFQTQLRLWDVFLLDGYDVFVAVAVAIVWVYRGHITSSTANFETVLSLLSSFFIPENENVFLSWIEKALGDKKLRANMRQWREDWKSLVAAGKDGTALL